MAWIFYGEMHTSALCNLAVTGGENMGAEIWAVTWHGPAGDTRPLSDHQHMSNSHICKTKKF